MTKSAQTHFSADGKTAACGSTADPNWFSPVPDEVTCKRCQKSYVYMETVDALTRPEGTAPRYTRPAYAKAVEESTGTSALRNAKAQVIEEAREKEPEYELSYTITSHRVKQYELLDVMETLLNYKATNIKVTQIS